MSQNPDFLPATFEQPFFITGFPTIIIPGTLWHKLSNTSTTLVRPVKSTNDISSSDPAIIYFHFHVVYVTRLCYEEL